MARASGRCLAPAPARPSPSCALPWWMSKPRVGLTDHGTATSRYYLRFVVQDRPGVLADIAAVLGKQKISIASMIQHEAATDDALAATDDAPLDRSTPVVSLVIMTHAAQAGAVAEAIGEIDQLDAIRRQSVTMRVLD